MSDPIKNVKAVFNEAEDVAPDGTLEAPMESDVSAPRTPPDDPNEPPQLPDNEKIFYAAEQPLNDYGNGQRFVIHFGEDVMFVPRVGWFTWTGQVWLKDADQLAVRARAQKIWSLIEKETAFLQPSKKDKALLAEEHRLKDRRIELEVLPEAEQADDHKEMLGTIAARLKTIDATLKSHKSLIGRRLTHAKNAGNNSPISHMLTESTTDLAVAFESLDAWALDVNTQSGLLRFSYKETGDDKKSRVASQELIPHDRDQLLSKMMPVEYDPTAKAPLFEAFLVRIQPDREMREFLKRWLGLSMCGLKYQKLAFFFGDGSNGKSVLVDLMGRMFAGYAASMRIESLTGSNRRSGAEATPDLIPLLGARFVRTSEPDQGEKLQEGLIKQLTGGEPIPVRANYGEQIDLIPHFKLTMSGNYKPEIRGTDNGIWRRVMLVPFDVEIPEEERDEDLGEKLWAERAGIFNWLVDGLLDFIEGGLAPPANVRDATEEYREESDPIGGFLTSCCTITGDHTDAILSKELGDAFNYYLLERGMSTWKPTTFAKQISAKSRQWRHPQSRKQFTKSKASLSQYTGLKLTEQFGRRFRDAPRDNQGRPIGVKADDSTPHPDLDDFRE
jgi:putative DNA primase/helicase